MKEIKTPITELVFIIDRSGSMSGLEADTVGGFNSNLKKYRDSEGTTLVTTALFSNQITVLHDRLDVCDVPEMSLRDYSVGGSTALYDAVGTQIEHIGAVHKYIREEDVPEYTVFVIMTDGYENASHRFTHRKIREMIEEKRENGWEFVFLGANIDTEEVARGLGMNEDLALNFCATPTGVVEVFDDIWCAVDKASAAVKERKKK